MKTMRVQVFLTSAAILLFLPLFTPVYGQAGQSGAAKQQISNILGSGARALGMGGAFIAIADDATAASWNPAGLAILTRPEVSLVYSDIDSQEIYDYDYAFLFTDAFAPGEDLAANLTELDDIADSTDSGIDFASATWPAQLFNRNVVTQLSYRRIFSLPDLVNEWTEVITFTDVATGEVLFTSRSPARFETDGGGSVDAYSVSFALPIVRGLNVGATVNYVDGSLGSRATLTIFEPDVDNPPAFFVENSEQDFDFDGLMYDLGVQYNMNDRFFVGAVYHTGFTADADETFSFSTLFDGEEFSDSFSTSGEVDIPETWGVGVAFRPIDRLTLSADYTQSNWSEGVFVDDDGFETPFPSFGEQQFDSTAIRAGGEYVFFLGNNVFFPVRAGWFEEEQISNFWGGESQPSFDGYSLGAGIAIGSIQFDVAWVDTSGDERGVLGVVFDEPDDDPNTLDRIEIVNQNRDFSSERLVLSAIYRF
ncbi:MAG: outer membrane protein transport protein [Acidobacteria bacterium]|nr:outer membrane protein transport protein [Acidobacteriota bacterium]